MIGDQQQDKDAGFSLVELMIVVVIISILSIAIVPRLIDRPDQARVARAQSDIASIVTALDLYRLDNATYPTQDQGLQALVSQPSTPPVPNNWPASGYLRSLPDDPWGQPYQFLNPGLNGEIDVFSFGSDGIAGGDGTGEEIGSWALNP